jgi:hypothetical protein
MYKILSHRPNEIIYLTHCVRNNPCVYILFAVLFSYSSNFVNKFDY